MIKKKYYCEHNRRKSTCKDCRGGSICEHNRIKYQCKDCGGNGICEHDRIKSRCKDCGGGSICEHNRRKSTCKDCGGGSICEHNRIKYQCKDCGGNGICEHDKIKSRCKDCGGGSICEHNRRKSTCKECKGIGVCIHDREKNTCNLCSTNKNKFCKKCQQFLVNKPKTLCSVCDDKAYKKTKEYELKEFLNSNYNNIIYNKSINLNNSCKKYRPDFLIDCLNFFLIIECDEYGHRNYKCEEVRMNDIIFQLGLPCTFIRYNPDSKVDKITKHRVLKSYIDYYINKQFVNPEVVYLFF